MKIKPKVGLDDIRFGMSRSEIINHLGEPTNEFTDEFGDLILCYSGRGISLKIEKENKMKLGWIEVANPAAEIYETKPIGAPFREVYWTIHQILGETEEIEEHGTWSSTTFKGSWIEIQETLGWVQQINIGVPYEGDEPAWPNEAEQGD